MTDTGPGLRSADVVSVTEGPHLEGPVFPLSTQVYPRSHPCKPTDYPLPSVSKQNPLDASPDLLPGGTLVYLKLPKDPFPSVTTLHLRRVWSPRGSTERGLSEASVAVPLGRDWPPKSDASEVPGSTRATTLGATRILPCKKKNPGQVSRFLWEGGPRREGVTARVSRGSGGLEWEDWGYIYNKTTDPEDRSTGTTALREIYYFYQN